VPSELKSINSPSDIFLAQERVSSISRRTYRKATQLASTEINTGLVGAVVVVVASESSMRQLSMMNMNISVYQYVIALRNIPKPLLPLGFFLGNQGRHYCLKRKSKNLPSPCRLHDPTLKFIQTVHASKTSSQHDYG
jgi:hypothetical protein